MRARQLLLMLAGGLTALVDAAPAVGATLRAVRHITRPAVTTLILEFSEPVRYRLDRAPVRNVAGVPPRLYLDVAGSRVAPGVVIPRHLSEGPLRRVRAGQQPSGIRFILDVPGLTEYGVFPMHDPFRLVLDIRAPAAPPSADTAGSGNPKVEKKSRTTRRGSVKGTQNDSAPKALTVRHDRGRRSAAAPPVAAAAPKRFKIVVDPGHGGKDPGAIGAAGVAEKDVVLEIARHLRRLLVATGDFEVVLTRDADVYLPLQARTALANEEEADLFISIHANASPKRDRAGAETYYLNDTEDRATLRLAEMENGLRSMTGAEGHDRDAAVILSSLIQNYKIEESLSLAEQVQRSLVEALRRNGTPVEDLGVKSGPFYVLVGAGMPCVLVEASFITHPREGRRLAQPSYQKAVARGLVHGIRRFAAHARVAENL